MNLCIRDIKNVCTFIISATEKTCIDEYGHERTYIDVCYSKPTCVGDGLELHPLYDKINKDNQDLDGVIVYKNEITTSMVKYLLMTEEELKKYIGPHTEPVRYKCDIIKGLALHWV